MARRFQFSLQALLHVRRVREREAARRLAAVGLKIARADALARRTNEQILQQQAALHAVQEQAAPDLATLQRGRAWIAHLRRMLAQLGSERAQLLTESAVLREALTAARRAARVVEKLRERRYEAHRKTAARREMGEADELARLLPREGWTVDSGAER